jgi:hypothetical protein
MAVNKATGGILGAVCYFDIIHSIHNEFEEMMYVY